MPQKLAAKLDSKWFSHSGRLLEILQTMCVSHWVKTQTVQSFFVKVACEQLMAWCSG